MISAILLAAGQSKRMINENKLTKKIKGMPLIKHAVKKHKANIGISFDETVSRKTIASLLKVFSPDDKKNFDLDQLDRIINTIKNNY